MNEIEIRPQVDQVVVDEEREIHTQAIKLYPELDVTYPISNSLGYVEHISEDPI